MNEYILTFDVGIKNLAFCLAKYNNFPNKSENILNNLTIIDWNIIDVSYKPLYCKQIKNKRAICNCISKYYSLIDSNISDNIIENLIGYCKNHYKLITNHYKINKVSKNNQIKFFKISQNLIYKENFNTQIDRLLYALDIFYNKIILNPYDINNNKLLFINNLKIYIENQPSFKNPVMKTISIVIFTYFSIKKLVNPNIIYSINFISASAKTNNLFITKLNKLMDLKSSINIFKNYDKRKSFAIDITNQIIKLLDYSINNITAISKYIICKKKDDYADTLIYVIYTIILNLI